MGKVDIGAALLGRWGASENAPGREVTVQNRVNPVCEGAGFGLQFAGAPIRGVRCEIHAKARKRLHKRFILFFVAADLSHPLIGASKHCHKQCGG